MNKFFRFVVLLLCLVAVSAIWGSAPQKHKHARHHLVKQRVHRRAHRVRRRVRVHHQKLHTHPHPIPGSGYVPVVTNPPDPPGPEVQLATLTDNKTDIYASTTPRQVWVSWADDGTHTPSTVKVRFARADVLETTPDVTPETGGPTGGADVSIQVMGYNAATDSVPLKGIVSSTTPGRMKGYFEVMVDDPGSNDGEHVMMVVEIDDPKGSLEPGFGAVDFVIHKGKSFKSSTSALSSINRQSSLRTRAKGL